jgi:hypothetical protein
MSSPECDSERTRVAEAIEALPKIASGIRELTGPRAQPQRSGCRLVIPGRPDVYVVDPAGYRRRIPNHTTYDRLFRDWRGIVDSPDLEDIAERPALKSASILVRGDGAARIYILDEGRKRLIPNDTVMDKYWFNWGRICVVRQILIDHVPEGDPWG